MKATATRENGFRHTVKIRSHELAVDERAEAGGTDTAPEPLELLAAALAPSNRVTGELHAGRTRGAVGLREVTGDYSPAERGCPTRFNLVMRFPGELSEEQVDRLRIIAAKCPVHRTLDGEVMFDERVERVTLAH